MGIERRVGRRSADDAGARCDLLVARIAARDWSVVSIDELRRCGLTRDAVAGRVRRGTLFPIYRGVYAVGHPNPPLEGRFLGAVKAQSPRAFLSHYACAAHWRLVEWDGRLPEVTVAVPGGRGTAGVKVHRSTTLTRDDVRRHQGIPVTAPARTIVDLASVLPRRPLRRAVRQALSLELVSVPHLLAVIDRHGRFRGKRALVRILELGQAPTRSELEDVVLELIVGAGFERPDVNVPMMIDGRRVIPDFRWPRERLIVEADGAAWHENALAREDDAERQAMLEAQGERVLRVSWQQATTRRAEMAARLAAAGAPQARPATS